MTAAAIILVWGLVGATSGGDATAWEERVKLMQEAGQDGTSLKLRDMIKTWNPKCLQHKCKHTFTECRDDSPSCQQRLGCMKNEMKKGMTATNIDCFRDVHFLDMSKSEMSLFGCAEKHRCIGLTNQYYDEEYRPNLPTYFPPVTAGFKHDYTREENVQPSLLQTGSGSPADVEAADAEDARIAKEAADNGAVPVDLTAVHDSIADLRALEQPDQSLADLRVNMGVKASVQENEISEYLNELKNGNLGDGRATPGSFAQVSGKATKAKIPGGAFLAGLNEFQRQTDSGFGRIEDEIKKTFGTDAKAEAATARQEARKRESEHLRFAPILTADSP